MDLIQKVFATGVSQDNIDDLQIDLKTGDGNTNLSDLIATVINFAVWIAGILAFVYLVYAGILYITANGNPDQAKKGQQGIINAVIGIVIVVFAYLIVRAVTNTAEDKAGLVHVLLGGLA